MVFEVPDVSAKGAATLGYCSSRDESFATGIHIVNIALENGARGFCFSSGMAAIATVTHLLKAGAEILADWDLYGGASRLFGKS
jgi:cystathionine beta-lyase/cystathionine gamma-synthase